MRTKWATSAEQTYDRNIQGYAITEYKARDKTIGKQLMLSWVSALDESQS